MKKIPLSKTGKNAGKYFALVDDEDFNNLNQFNWCVSFSDNKLYAARKVDNKFIKMHRTILNLSDEKTIVDHINGNGLDNRRLNLRIVNASENAFNRSIQRSKTGYKGVALKPKHTIKKYEAYIKHRGKRISLGYYADVKEAAKTYNNKATELFGQFAKLNQLDGLQ